MASLPESLSYLPVCSADIENQARETTTFITRYSYNHRDYLKHPVYRKYLLMHKLCLGDKGSEELERLAGELSSETDPNFLSAAASAYLETGIIRANTASAEQKQAFADEAQRLWTKALQNEDSLLQLELNYERDGETKIIDDITAPYRIATNLACLPMVRSMFSGDVKDTTINSSLKSLLSIGELVSQELNQAYRDNNKNEYGQFKGFYYEIDTLVALLYHRDPRFIAIPAFQRADTGYFYPDQTHDIELISQHYGTVRAILPIEVKERIRGNNRRRYRSLLVGGRVHLQTTAQEAMPQVTREAYEHCLEGDPSQDDVQLVNSTQLALRSLVSSYKRTGKYQPLKRHNSPTTYYRGELDKKHAR